MHLNQRLLAALLAICFFGPLVRADEPCADVKRLSDKKPEAPKIPAELTHLPDQLYCMPDKDTKLMADVLLPKAGTGPNPAVVCINGGGWVKGSRRTNLPIMIKLAEAGYVAVSVQYRLAQEAPFPGAVHDVKCAVRWLRANAGVFHVDPDRIAALGYSSGGQLACLLGLTTPLDGLEGEGGFNTFPSRVQVAISYYGISDLAEWHKDSILAPYCLGQFMGGAPDKLPDLYAKASPISYARKDMAAVFLIHGTKDTLVPIKQAERLEKKLKAAGADVRLLAVEGAGHNFTGKTEDEADAAMLKFLAEAFRSKRAAKAPERRER